MALITAAGFTLHVNLSNHHDQGCILHYSSTALISNHGGNYHLLILQIEINEELDYTCYVT